MALLQQARELEQQGRDIIHMEVGEPLFELLPSVRNAMEASLAMQDTRYTPATGLPSLKLALSQYYRKRYGVEIDPGRFVVTTGSSAALLLLGCILMRAGDEVLVTDPGYPCNANFARVFRAHPKTVPLLASKGYRLQIDEFAASWSEHTRGAILASPANPVGVVFSHSELQAIRDVICAREGFLVMDEIYHGLTYVDDCPSMLEVDPDAIVVNSFSKYFGMTGMRVGWMVVPEELVGDVDKLAQNLFIAPPTLSQHGAVAALSEDSLVVLDARCAELKSRRDYLYNALSGLGFSIAGLPDGAFYLYAGIEQFIERGIASDAEAFCSQMLHEVGVAVTPGIDFGELGASTHVRFTFTESLGRLEQAVERIGNFVGSA
jgi:aspartate/methionine/tyrosine aminotransferase